MPMTTMTTTKPAGPEDQWFRAWRNNCLFKVESALNRAIDSLEKGQPPEVQNLTAAMRYALLGGGKRLRPLLALAGAEAVAGRLNDALPAACAVEMIHAYSLIHDDLPAMDDDDQRRGRPTCHKAFGEGTAILAGDALLTLAFETLAEGADKNPEKAQRAVQATLILSRAAGALGMVGGQALDLAYENRCDIHADLVWDMEMRKTGELTAGAIMAGAAMAGGPAPQVQKLRDVGLNAGLAFQIRDDLLNQSGDAETLGKAVGSDQARGKASFPAVTNPETAAKTMLELAERAKAAADIARNGNARPLIALIDQMINRQR